MPIALYHSRYQAVYLFWFSSIITLAVKYFLRANDTFVNSVSEFVVNQLDIILHVGKRFIV